MEKKRSDVPTAKFDTVYGWRRSSSDMTFSPFSFRRAAVMPLPTITRPENVPSWICPTPQEGLLCLRMTSRAPYNLANRRVSRAPLRKFSVTSIPFFVITRWPRCSAGIRGVGNPPNCSGQTGINVSRRSSLRISSFLLLPPSYTQSMPSRQALQSFMILEKRGGWTDYRDVERVRPGFSCFLGRLLNTDNTPACKVPPRKHRYIPPVPGVVS